MTDHDPMCPQYDQTERTIAMFDTPCRCEEYARVRADEREAPPIGGLDVVRCWKMDMAHAEAVAARLVEVICEQEAEPRCRTCGIRTLRAQILTSVTALMPDEYGRVSKGLVQAMISGDVT